jgi:hypothetical protein
MVHKKKERGILRFGRYGDITIVIPTKDGFSGPIFITVSPGSHTLPFFLHR